MPAAPAGGHGLVRRGFVWTVVVSLTTAALLVATARPAMAHAIGTDGTPHTPVVMDPIDDDGRYAATIAYDSGGSWTVRFTAVTPTATIEGVKDVAEPTATTTRVESTDTTRSTATSSEQAASDPDDGGIGVGGVLAALFLSQSVVGCGIGFARSAFVPGEDR